MKLEIARNEILFALQSAIGVVERRQTLPVLSNFLLDAKERELVVTGTDLELELVCRAQAEVKAPGRTTVPARKLFDICRGLPEGAQITLESSADRIQLKSGRSRYTLSTLKPEDFPSLGDVARSQTLRLQKAELRQLLEQTQFAMAHQDVRYYLNGLLLHVQPKRLRVVATDGHRLALSELERVTGVKDEIQVILPRKTVVELMRLIEPSEEAVELHIGGGQVQVDLDVVRLSSKLIDGRFPDYERVIPEHQNRQLTANREVVRQALTRSAILSNEKFRGVRLKVDGNKLQLQTHNPEHEEAEEELEVAYTGSPLEIGFNVNYLLDALGAMKAEQFTLELKGADASGLIYDAGGGPAKYVIMPMRL
jgi:DNA polymerase III subunit beta